MIEIGGPVHAVTEDTKTLANRAVEELHEQIRKIAGRIFYGDTGVAIRWENGQIIEVRPHFDRKLLRKK